MEGVTYEKEEILLTTKPNLFTLRTITLHEPEILNVVIFGAKAST
jgi:hypothetical protein